MAVNVMKGFIGYVFLVVLAGACIYTGVISFKENVPSAIFALLVGVILLAVGVVMSLRKR